MIKNKKHIGFYLLLLIGLFFTVILYSSYLSSRSADESITKAVYTPFKSLGAAYTVTRTYTSKSNVLINNLWRATQDIKGGLSHACALSNGKVYCWGRNDAGQLGNGTTTNSSLPVVAGGALAGKYVTAIAAGGSHSCAIAEGRAYCWGSNGSGRLGNGPNNGTGGASSGTTDQSSPVAVNTSASSAMGTKNVTNIAVGGFHTCAIAEAQAYCWGRGGEGQIGNGQPANPNADYGSANTNYSSMYPLAINGGSFSVTAIATGSNHTCAIAGGLAYCWGGKADNPPADGVAPCHGGRIGDSSNCGGNKNAPVAVNTAGVLSGKVVTDIAAGASQSCAIADGRVYCWGFNGAGEVGDGTTTGRLTPVAVSTTSPSALSSTALVTSIAAGVYTGTDGEYQTCAVADGKAYCWGDNTYGQLGNNNTGTDSSYPVAVSSSGVLSGKYVTQVSPGSPFACAIGNGRAYCWGKNDYGQLGNNTTTNINVPYRVNDSYY